MPAPTLANRFHIIVSDQSVLVDYTYVGMGTEPAPAGSVMMSRDNFDEMVALYASLKERDDNPPAAPEEKAN